MRTAVWYNNRDIRIEEIDRPEPGADELLVKILACGICGSDIVEWYRLPRAPLVPGHEVSGRIAAAGNHVRHLEVGDRVGLGWHAGYCMTCPSCLSGDHNMCASSQGTIVGHHGGFADKVRCKAAWAIPLPDGVDAAKAGHTGSLDPLATGLLPLCFGHATKLSSYLLDADKSYRFRCQLGAVTDPGDAEGRVIERPPLPPGLDAARIDAARAPRLT